MLHSTARLNTALAERYAIERELGAGGMAVVYAANDLRHDRQVALKVLRPELAAVIGAERFLAEIKTTANLQHPHILGLIDSGETDGLLWYVMPFVEGESLRDRLRREKQLPVEDALRLTREVASALDYAHRHGVIHRDIKPENILLHDGQALVADFGIALAVSSAGGTRMTETGLSLGTPHYMSPEQAMGEREITARSDVYALGCVLYEMLVGEPPFTGPTAQAIIAKVMTSEPLSLTAQRRSVPAHVQSAVFTALEKLPADRFPTASAFAAALVTGSATAEAVSGRHRVGSRVPDWRTVALAAGALIVGAIVGRLTSAPPAAPAVGRFVLATGADHRITGRPVLTVALSPDASTLVYVGQSPRGTRLYRRRLSELSAVPLAGTEDAENPIFTPDGRHVLFGTTAGLRRIAAGGGPTESVPTDGLPTPNGAIPLEDGSILFTSLDGVLRRVWRDGTARIVATPDPSTGESALFVSATIPRSNIALAVAGVGSGVVGRGVAIDLETGRRTVVLDQLISGIAYAEGFLTWVQQDGMLVGSAFDARRLRVTGSPVAIAQGVRVSVGGAPQFALSGQGTLVYVPEQPFELMAVSRGGQTQRLIDAPRRYHSPRVSPDGRYIAVDFPQQESRDVWIFDRRQRTVSRLSFDNDGHDPVWSPDGRRVAYASARGSVIGMFMRNADGSGVAESVLVAQTARTVAAFTPDQRHVIVLTQAAAGNQDLELLALDGERALTPILASPFNEQYAALSPNGRWLAYVSDESGQFEVYVRPFPGPGPKVLLSQNGGTEPVWSRDGRELFYRGFGAEGMPMLALGLETEPEVRVISRTELFDASEYEFATPHANYDVGPDGEFVMVYQGHLSQMVLVQNWPEEVRRRGASAGQ